MRGPALKNAEFRPGGHSFGAHRVLEPKSALPQAALRLDASLPIFENEILVEVKRLHVDSASFRQLRESGPAESIASRVAAIVRERGKMHNQATNSGGMLIGKVLERGPMAQAAVEVGQEVATLVSLTLTPLHLDAVRSVDLERGEVDVDGYAILFGSTVVAPLPEDFSSSAALRIFDVCGAPAWVQRLVKPGDHVLIVGAGNSGLLAAAAARETIDRDALHLVDVSSAALENPALGKLAGRLSAADAQDPIGFADALGLGELGDYDLVINACNAPETEAASILAARRGGRVLFFNMATQFQRAVLTAEGLGRDVMLYMGNGYAEGHWQYAVELARRHSGLRRHFEGIGG